MLIKSAVPSVVFGDTSAHLCSCACVHSDTFTDSAISSSRVNGEHREKVLQRWDGDGNGENFELESDTVRKRTRAHVDRFGLLSKVQSPLEGLKLE